MLEAEEDYKRENWYYSSYDDEYYEDEDDVVEVFVWNEKSNIYDRETISQDSLRTENYITFEDSLYIGYYEETQKPYGYENEDK